MQRQVLKEMEQQLQSSHQLTAQLRAQVRRPRAGGTWLWERACTPGWKARGGPSAQGGGSALGGPTDLGSSPASPCCLRNQG